MKIIQCIPNFSEGRDQKIIQGLVEIARSIPGVTLLDVSSDENHNRSVFTLIGDEKNIEEAAFRLGKFAVENIDLTKHRGEHPRMGAVDVIPFVPIRDASMEDCIDIAKRLGERCWNELSLPSFLYEEAASKASRRNLADIRRGQFEGMAEKLVLKEWVPDFGERKIHPTAGVVGISARFPMVAFNVNLNTSDVSIAKNIAKAVRHSSGGYAFCKAIGLYLEDQKLAQVSMNMTNYEKTPLYRVFETIVLEAKRYGVTVKESEIIGLIPGDALIDTAKYYLQTSNFDPKIQVLENRLED
ncbi:MAG: glutamate formimidoyltransferase [Gallicola sp.]|nr:glutamate formimidoyltransferase [Gallicola sp.]